MRVGSLLPIRNVRSTAAFGGRADNICSLRGFLSLTDAVEKVGSKSRMRNNRIEEACCSNQSCANYWFLESKLPCGTLKIFFQQYRPKADFNSSPHGAS
jgi:hypothetical protein